MSSHSVTFRVLKHQQSESVEIELRLIFLLTAVNFFCLHNSNCIQICTKTTILRPTYHIIVIPRHKTKFASNVGESPVRSNFLRKKSLYWAWSPGVLDAEAKLDQMWCAQKFDVVHCNMYEEGVWSVFLNLASVPEEVVHRTPFRQVLDLLFIVSVIIVCYKTTHHGVFRKFHNRVCWVDGRTVMCEESEKDWSHNPVASLCSGPVWMRPSPKFSLPVGETAASQTQSHDQSQVMVVMFGFFSVWKKLNQRANATNLQS